jgi:phage shock protein C
MFCSRCGMKLTSTSRSCSACGAKADAPYWQTQRSAPLLRPLRHRIFGGVCAAIALHYGWRRSRVRWVAVLLTLFHGVGFIAYLVAWLIIPRETYPNQIQST